jgi:hypothetical protein
LDRVAQSTRQSNAHNRHIGQQLLDIHRADKSVALTRALAFLYLQRLIKLTSTYHLDFGGIKIFYRLLKPI